MQDPRKLAAKVASNRVHLPDLTTGSSGFHVSTYSKLKAEQDQMQQRGGN